MKNFISNGKDLIFKNKKNILIAVVVVLVLFFGIFKIITSAFGKGDASTISSNQVVTLKKGDVTNAVNEKGKAVPSNSVEIFAEKSLPVVNLSVKVGDEVKRGDIIGELDSSSIRQQLDSRKAQKDANDKNISSQISAAKKRLSEAISGRDSGSNSALVSAQTAVTQALDQYLLAQKNYDDFKRSIDERYNEGIVAERSVRENAAYQEEAQNLRYRQQKEDIDNNINKIAEKRAMAIDKGREENSLQSDVDNLKRQLTEIGINIKNEQERLSNAQAKLSEFQTTISSLNAEEKQLQAENLKLKDKEKIRENKERLAQITNEILETQNRINDLNFDGIKNSANSNIDNLTRTQNEIEIEMNRVSEELAKAKADQSKYEQEADSIEKELETQSKNMESAKLELEKAREDLKQDADKNLKSQKSRDDQLKTLAKNVEIAKNNYDAALQTLDSTKKQVDNEISSLSDNLKTARAGANNIDSVEISHLTEELEKTLIRATADGTITELNAKEGEVPTGSVAKIETINTLRIESQVKEYDRNSVKVGTEVEITSDAILDKTFKGRVISIDPVPMKQGADNKSADVYYKTVIELEEGENIEGKLSAGMTLRVKYILSQTKDTFKVPTEAIFERDGKKYILTLEESGKDRYTTKKVEITTGISNDVETAISSNKLKEGTKVLASAGGYGEGSILKIIDSSEVSNESK